MTTTTRTAEANLVHMEPNDSRYIRPKALIVTIYGLYAREAGGWLSIGSLIKLMGELGIDAPAVRSSISRLKRRGMVVPERVGGTAGYALSDHARTVLDEGDRRIFERPRASTTDGWMLVVFSVPESERQKRHMLRSRLSWLGYGTVSAGVWIAPGHIGAETSDVLQRYDLIDYVDLFHANYFDSPQLRQKVSTWWDLEGLQNLYNEFLDLYQPALARWKRRRTVDDGQAFADYVSALTVWRRLPFLDPGLAPTLLPPAWSGVRAADLFRALSERLAEPAHRHVDAVTSDG